MPGSKNNIPDKIGPFRRYKAKQSTMKYGYYYDAVFKLPFAPDKRHVRVWLPESYDFDSDVKYPVMYMSDGQNLVDYYLTAYGDWHLDRVMHELKEKGHQEAILVGIDCPKVPIQRTNELNPPYRVRHLIMRGTPNKPIGDQFVNYIADVLKPLIDSLFHTSPSIESTAIGGSSMGGIMAFFGFVSRPDVFGFSLSFSPPFFFYTHAKMREILDKWDVNPSKQNRIYLYVGGKSFERRFVRGTVWMYEELKRRGFGGDMIALSVDKERPHHEEAWADHSFDAFAFWLG